MPEDQAGAKTGSSQERLNSRLEEIRTHYAKELDAQKPAYERKIRIEKNAEQADISIKSAKSLYGVLEAAGISTDSLTLNRRDAADTEVGDSCTLILNRSSYQVFFCTDGTTSRISKYDMVYCENDQWLLPIK